LAIVVLSDEQAGNSHVPETCFSNLSEQVQDSENAIIHMNAKASIKEAGRPCELVIRHK
jgi:hypothetical protein